MESLSSGEGFEFSDFKIGGISFDSTECTSVFTDISETELDELQPTFRTNGVYAALKLCCYTNGFADGTKLFEKLKWIITTDSIRAGHRLGSVKHMAWAYAQLAKGLKGKQLTPGQQRHLGYYRPEQIAAFGIMLKADQTHEVDFKKETNTFKGLMKEELPAGTSATDFKDDERKIKIPAKMASSEAVMSFLEKPYAPYLEQFPDQANGTEKVKKAWPLTHVVEITGPLGQH
jgi:hypothetical protein